MGILLWAECRKLRRSKILWIAGFAVVMVSCIVFAQGQFTFFDSRYIDEAGWFMTTAQSLATFYVLPAVIALLGSYIICREEQEDTLKSLRLIPVDEVRLTFVKMLLALALGVMIYLLLFAITFTVEAVLHLGALSAGLVLESLKTYLLNGIGIFLALSPIIALVAWIKKGYWLALIFAEIYSFAGVFASMSSLTKNFYPITAALQLSGYSEASALNRLSSFVSITLCVCIALFILRKLNYQSEEN
jgi:bacitracin transport system permease protein